MTIAQISAKWDGLTGLPGYTFVYVRSTASSPNPLQAFFEAIKSYLPLPLTVQVPNSGRLIDETNGKMTGVWGAGTTTTTSASGVNTYPPQAGAQVKWDTNDFVNGRRVRGRTYIVPLTTSAFSSGGLIGSTVANAINAAATTMISSYTGNLVIWSRPLFELDADGNPTEVLKRAGSIHTVSTSTCPLKSVTLNRRRDP